MLPSKSLASKEENSAPGHKKRKERLTILACANASGNHKMKLTVIGKSAKPRALKNITKEALPVHYTNQKNNAPSHPDDDELRCGEIRAIYFPANVTSQSDDESVADVLRNVSLRDVVYWIADSWEEVQPTTVIKSWTKFLPELVTPIEKINDDDSETIALKDLMKKLPGCENSNAVNLNEWLNSDDKLEITDSSIIEMTEDEEEYETEINDSSLSEKKISHSEGSAALELALKYVEQQTEATPADVLLLKRWLTIASTKRSNILKQQKIDNFFKL
nr:jerky protein homolog-like [Parasteatoda tepidariorum]